MRLRNKVQLFDFVLDLFLQILFLFRILERSLHEESDLISAVFVIDKDLILRACVFDLFQHIFDLSREDIDAFDLDHIVCPSQDNVYPRKCPAARTRNVVRDNPCKVVRSVSDERRAFFLERGNDQLAQLAVRKVMPVFGSIISKYRKSSK